MFWLRSVRVLSRVIVIFWSSIAVLTPNDNFWVALVLLSVSEVFSIIIKSYILKPLYRNCRSTCDILQTGFTSQVSTVGWHRLWFLYFSNYKHRYGAICAIKRLIIPGKCYVVGQDVLYFGFRKGTLGRHVVNSYHLVSVNEGGVYSHKFLPSLPVKLSFS